MGFITDVPLTGIVPTLNVLGPRFTVGIRDGGLIVNICPP